MDLLSACGDRIKIARRARGLSQKELMGLLGEKYALFMCKAQWSKIESNQTRVSPEILYAVCEIFGRNADWFVFGKDSLDKQEVSSEAKDLASLIDALDDDLRSSVIDCVRQATRLAVERREARARMEAMNNEIELLKRKLNIKESSMATDLPSGYIYFITAPEAGRIKIGYTTKPEKRISGLMTSSAYRLETLRIIEGTREQEQAMHDRFAYLRVHREWFSDCAELREFIETLK